MRGCGEGLIGLRHSGSVLPEVRAKRSKIFRLPVAAVHADNRQRGAWGQRLRNHSIAHIDSDVADTRLVGIRKKDYIARHKRRCGDERPIAGAVLACGAMRQLQAELPIDVLGVPATVERARA